MEPWDVRELCSNHEMSRWSSSQLSLCLRSRDWRRLRRGVTNDQMWLEGLTSATDGLGALKRELLVWDNATATWSRQDKRVFCTYLRGHKNTYDSDHLIIHLRLVRTKYSARHLESTIGNVLRQILHCFLVCFASFHSRKPLILTQWAMFPKSPYFNSSLLTY